MQFIIPLVLIDKNNYVFIWLNFSLLFIPLINILLLSSMRNVPSSLFSHFNHSSHKVRIIK